MEFGLQYRWKFYFCNVLLIFMCKLCLDLNTVSLWKFSLYSMLEQNIVAQWCVNIFNYIFFCGLVGKVGSPDFEKFTDMDTDIGHVQTCLFFSKTRAIFVLLQQWSPDMEKEKKTPKFPK